MKKFTILFVAHLFFLFSFYINPLGCVAQPMSVDSPGYLQGAVTDADNGSAIANVTVTAMGSTDTLWTETAANGTYSLTLEAGTYDIKFKLIGLQTVIVANTIVSGGNTTVVNAALCEEPYPVPWVFADPNEADTRIIVTWGEPEGAYEVIYEDGNAEDYFVSSQTGAGVAVRFTPNGYPATAEGGRIYVGDGSFPAGADFLGKEFSIGVLDDDGPDGLPGTVLDSITVTVNNYFWVEFDGLDVTFEEGEFYLVMWQLESPPEAAPIGIDTDFPKVYRSYISQNGSNWTTSPYQDFMMRATVNGVNMNVMKGSAQAPLKESADDRDFDRYKLVWIDDFDPDAGEGPEDGTKHHRVYLSHNYFDDFQWGPRPPGFYAWGVQAHYECGDTSEFVYSNVVAHKLDNEVTISVNLSNDSPPENVDILMVGKNYPYQEFQGIATVLAGDTIAEMLVDSAIDGLYDLHVSSPGFEDYVINDVEILTDSVVPVEMQELTFVPRNLFVDSLTSVANWDIPLITQLANEDFEDEEFPPEGWSIRNFGGKSWFRSLNASDDDLTIPPGDGYYAVEYDNSYDGYHNPQYLITPNIDLRQSYHYKLFFDHFKGSNSVIRATVEYSINNSTTWEIFYTIALMPADWLNICIDLSPLSGPEIGLDSIRFAFVSEDLMFTYGAAWAIDNVSITAGPASPIGYYIYLNEALVGETSTGDTTYTFSDLIYGQTYTATVKARYSSGLSEPVSYTWTSGYLYPPRMLGNTYQTNSDRLPLYWLPPMIIDSIVNRGFTQYGKFSTQSRDSVIGHVTDSLLGFKVYQDGQWIADVEYNDEGVNDTIHHIIYNLDPACYSFEVTAIYDLSQFGFPGEEGESMPAGPDTVCLLWGNELPFLETWDEGGFATNAWRLEGDGWVINNEIGAPEPSAEFKAEMISGDSVYSSTLTSNPLLGNGLTEGDIFLDFNVKLININETAEEKLFVEITNDAGQTWTRVAEIWNSYEIGFEDGFNHINITAQAMGKAFHIRFMASGANASDIESWFIDNINIYRSCAAPTNIEGSYVWHVNDWGAEIKWDAPELPVGCGMWLYWDNEVYAGGVGLTDGGTWSLAQRWDAGQLKNWQGEDLTGSQISKMSFVLNDDGFENITLMIWSGPNAGILLYEQEVINPPIGDWSVVDLDEPVFFDTDEELWIGYTITNQPAGHFPGGYDEGPAVPGYGDMISTDGGVTWDKISDFGIDNNWVVHAFPGPSSPGPSSKLAGFNLYRQEVEVDDDYFLYDFVTFEEGQLAYNYYDKYPAVANGQTYNYQVTSNWESKIDTCESVPALTIQMTEDYVSILVTAVESLEAAEVSLFPNPATNSLNISSNTDIKQITVFNYVGHLVFNQEFSSRKTAILNTSLYQAGIYVIRIDTENGAITKRVIITK